MDSCGEGAEVTHFHSRQFSYSSVSPSSEQSLPHHLVEALHQHTKSSPLPQQYWLSRG